MALRDAVVSFGLPKQANWAMPSSAGCTNSVFPGALKWKNVTHFGTTFTVFVYRRHNQNSSEWSLAFRAVFPSKACAISVLMRRMGELVPVRKG